MVRLQSTARSKMKGQSRPWYSFERGESQQMLHVELETHWIIPMGRHEGNDGGGRRREWRLGGGGGEHSADGEQVTYMSPAPPGNIHKQVNISNTCILVSFGTRPRGHPSNSTAAREETQGVFAMSSASRGGILQQLSWHSFPIRCRRSSCLLSTHTSSIYASSISAGFSHLRFFFQHVFHLLCMNHYRGWAERLVDRTEAHNVAACMWIPRSLAYTFGQRNRFLV